MTVVPIWDPIERVFYGLYITILFIAGIVFAFKRKDTEERSVKIMVNSLAIFFIGFAISEIFWFIGDLVIPGRYENYAFYGDSNLYYDDILFLGGYQLFFIVGIVGIFTSEVSIKRTKYIFSIITITLTISFFLTGSLILIVITVVMITFVFLILIFIITRWSPQEFKAISSFLYIGSIFLFFGATMDYPLVKEIESIPLVLPHILGIIGVLFIILPSYIKPIPLKRARVYWIVLGILVIASVWFFFPLYITPSTKLTDVVIISIVPTIPSILVIISIYNVLKEDRKEAVKESTDIFRAISRPQKVTEEEVSVSKEKKICLVCKGKVRKFGVFICDCGAFYCDKCVIALIELDNVCWACDSALDESKPVKLLEKMESEEIIEEEDIQKKTI
jgi:hypothetical protein